MMEKSHNVIFRILILIFLSCSSSGQYTSTTEAQLLYRIRRLLEYPLPLQGWTNWTNFCYLPYSPYLTITCSQNRITELTVIGNKGSPSESTQNSYVVSPHTLSSAFSIDSLFTTLTMFLNLKVLSLVSLGLWGSLPEKISRFSSLQVLNLSSNFIHGEIPPQVSTLKNLQTLDLHNNLFNGTVPDLSGLTSLQQLDLGRNLLGPQFPSLPHNLRVLKLGNNTFKSNVPSQLHYYFQLLRLDLSFNKLQGPIPPWLFSLPAIRSLNLRGNKLSGALSINMSCSCTLGFVDISRNLLFGRLPSCIHYNSSYRAVYYNWNCLSDGDTKYQHQYSFCHNEALAAIMPQTPTHKVASKGKVGLILAIAGGISGAILACALVMWIFLKRMLSKDEGQSTIKKSSMDVRFSPRLAPDACYTPQALRLGALGIPPYRIFTLEELEEATNKFHPSNLMIGGCFDQMYRGRIRDGSVVAVRCLKLGHMRPLQNLAEDMEVISKLRHRHLVSILGHCIPVHQDNSSTTDIIFLILECISNGTLRSHFARDKSHEMIKWPQRLAVAIGIVRGIQFLHAAFAPGIYGSNLSIDNIVLDASLTAKIGGYNLPISSKAKNTKLHTKSPTRENRLDVDDYGSIEEGVKGDIYQLGAIILQLITGKEITSHSELEDLKHHIEKGFTDGQPQIKRITDPTIHASYAYESLKTATQIAINCLSEDIKQRPSTEDVLWHLQYSNQVQESWAVSGNVSTEF